MTASTHIDGVLINYLRRAGSGGQRVLYIHGTGCNARVFERHMAVLDAGHDAVAIDLPGHGASGGHGFRGVADYAAAVTGLIRALDWDSCVVAGHSMGGGVALAAAVYDPELVKALILIDSGARLRVAPELIRGARLVAAGGASPRANPRYGFAAATPDAVVEGVRALTADCDPATIAMDWVADDTCDFMARLPSIGVATLAVCGREDVLTPVKYHEYLAKHMPDCTLHIIEQAGHWPFAEQPAHFDTVVNQFLARRVAGG